MKYSVIPGIIGVIIFILPAFASGAVLSLEPAAGAFVAGSTFTVSLLLDTEDELVNAIEAFLRFPPDKLQVVSPSTGLSIINIWTSNPSFDNRGGTISFQGIIPSGIYADKGLISTITFRAKSVGEALVRFRDKSRVLLSDGKGTDALRETANGFYSLILPPPSGPVVVSETHPDQSQWYSNSSPILTWASDVGVEEYSYVLSSDPTEVPDKISEGIRAGIAYKNLSNGTHYFSIKAMRNGVWGGVTTFAINVDVEPPAEFSLEISPSWITTNNRPTLDFQTTDAHSGISRYEYKLISLNPSPDKENLNFFIEAQLPEVLSLEKGKYDVVARVYDKAENLMEVTERLQIVTPFIKVLKSFWTWCIILFLLPVLGVGAYQVRKWHNNITNRKKEKELPAHVKNQVEELKKYRNRYGKLAVLFIIGSLWLIPMVYAQYIPLDPPFITTVSRNISNEEIFYVGGKSDMADLETVLYLQNLQTGETFSETVISNQKREWFYRHPTFLSKGEYLLWAQSKFADELSPPTPQVQMTVSATAIQFGASRLSYETLYLTIAVFLFLLSLGLIAFIVFHAHHGRKKHRDFRKEIREAEEAIRQGFAVIRRDVEAELALVDKIKMSKKLSAQEKEKEAQLLKDLDEIQRHIGKEVMDIEQIEGLH